MFLSLRHYNVGEVLQTMMDVHAFEIFTTGKRARRRLSVEVLGGVYTRCF